MSVSRLQSGTIGQPKAVMLSHDNLIQDARAITQSLQIEYGAEVLISYLPLSHVAAQVNMTVLLCL